jgi:hypothetical protein
MFSEEFHSGIARICLLVPALPGFTLILGAGLVFDGPPEVAYLLLGAGGMSVLETVLLMVGVVALPAGPLIKMSLEARLAWLAGSAALLVFDGFGLLLLGQPFACVVIGAGFGRLALTAYLLAVRWFDHYEMFQEPSYIPGSREEAGPFFQRSADRQDH